MLHVFRVLWLVCSEHANLSISLLSVASPGEVVGHMSLFDNPQLYEQRPDRGDWLTWIHKSYKYTKVSVSGRNWSQLAHFYLSNTVMFQPVNSLFVGLFVSKDGFQLAASSELIRYLVNACPPILLFM